MNLSQMHYYKQQKGYTFARLSELSNVPIGTIQKIFNGETKSPRYSTLQALEKVLRPEEPSSYIKETATEYMLSQGQYTLDDYYALPHEQRVELIDGVFYDMAAPSLPHQAACMRISYLIQDYIEQKKGTCKVFVSPIDVQLDCDNKTMVQPDILIICDKDKMRTECVFGAPDFVLEVLSPSTGKKDAFLKLTKYHNAGVREYWMVDIQKGRVVTYFFEEDVIPVIYGMEDEVPVRIYDGELKVDFAKASKYWNDIG